MLENINQYYFMNISDKFDTIIDYVYLITRVKK